VATAQSLQSNQDLSNRGHELGSAGFIVTEELAASLGLGTIKGLERYIRDYRNGRDLTDKPRNVKVIDVYGFSAEQLRSELPSIYQHLFERVKPERDVNRMDSVRENWWLHRRLREDLRKSLAGLPRYITTVETAKHRTFQFLDASILPDNKLIAIATADAFHLGVLSSQLHGAWALAAGSWLGVGNDPVYVKSRCFETFPFPDVDTGLTPALRSSIASLAEQIDAHRKRQQAAHPGLTLTGMYNVLEALRLHERAPAGEALELSAKEKLIHTQGLVAVLKTLHDELDSAVLAAYGLPEQISTDALLESLVQLNAQRAREEAAGRIRWLRPEFQDPAQALSNDERPAQQIRRVQVDLALNSEEKNDSGDVLGSAKRSSRATSAASQQAWPAELPAQVRAVSQVLSSSAQSFSLAQIEAHFKGRGAWKSSLPRILETLAALGKAQSDAQSDGITWRA
jgi:hypothetical protein